MKLNLTPQNKQEELILNYLQENASETLMGKINNGTPFEKDGKPLLNKKTLSGFMKYACDEARKLAEKGANSACVEDFVVYGWAIHYFEEESIEGTLYTIDGEEYKPAPKKSVNSKPVTIKPQPQKQQNIQFSFFDNLETEVSEKDTLPADTDTDEDETDMPSDEEIQEALAEVYVEEQQGKGNAMYQKYMSYQAEHPTAVVAYRLGDFYEVFGAYAVMLGNEMELTITSRDLGLNERTPMVGFPYHVAEIYFAKIVKKHDLYVIETDGEKQFIKRIETDVAQNINEDTGEILTEEEMREFDGDIEEPDDLFSTETTAPNVVQKLKTVLGDVFIVR